MSKGSVQSHNQSSVEKNICRQLIQGSATHGQQCKLGLFVLYITKALLRFCKEQSHDRSQGLSLGRCHLTQFPYCITMETLGLRVSLCLRLMMQGHKMISSKSQAVHHQKLGFCLLETIKTPEVLQRKSSMRDGKDYPWADTLQLSSPSVSLVQHSRHGNFMP